MKTCSKCNKKMKELSSKTPEGVEYNYFKCIDCGEEVVDIKQLHNVARKYRVMKRFHAKLSQWGMSLGLRIPKELVEKYHLRDDEKVTLIPEEEGIKVIPD